ADDKTSVLDSNGNWTSATSTFTTTDGQQRAVADVWFLTDRNDAAAGTAAPAAAAASTAADSPALGARVGALTQALSAYRTTGGGGDAGNALRLTAQETAAATSSLASNVTGLARQMQEFGGSAKHGAGDGLSDPGSHADLARKLAFIGILAAK
ncbi:hypothetical protein, partial [Rugamonas sp.]|uniref:hypothetical protein n=1 Tax=Rugamonas sp. TaxID=1926287 RepID=UPI0025CC1B2F